jgi:F420-0:gamma-glutamyl ligase
MYPSNYLGACDLMNREVKVTIKSVAISELVMVGGKKEQKPVMHFEGKNKAMVLNKTNATLIARMHGPDTESWIGKQVILYPTETKFGRDTVECIRVKGREAV